MQDHLKILNNNKVKNINIINFIDNNKIFHIQKIENSLIIKGKSDRNWIYLSCTNREELKIITNQLAIQDKCFGAIEEWMIPDLTKNKKILWKLSLKQYYLPDNINVPTPSHKTRPLSEKDATCIYQNSNYKDFLTIEHIINRINNGISKGIFENNKLVAWILTHDDGAMGFLHTMDPYRRKGFGTSLVLALTEGIRAIGEIPFACIEHDNIRSINLTTKLGFKYHKNVNWFELV